MTPLDRIEAALAAHRAEFAVALPSLHALMMDHGDDLVALARAAQQNRDADKNDGDWAEAFIARAEASDAALARLTKEESDAT